METVSITELEKHLLAYLEKVRAGDSILIFDEGRAIARLEPVVGADRDDDRLGRLERLGLVRRATGPVPVRSLRAVTARPAPGAVQAMIGDRAQDR